MSHEFLLNMVRPTGYMMMYCSLQGFTDNWLASFFLVLSIILIVESVSSEVK